MKRTFPVRVYTVVFLIVMTPLSFFSCLQDPEFCYDCVTKVTTSSNGVSNKTESTKEYCDKTAVEADKIEKEGTHVENGTMAGYPYQVTTVTLCQRR
jgi:hypothetical protein